MINKNSFDFKSGKGRLALTGNCTNADKAKLFTETRKLSPAPPTVTQPVLSSVASAAYTASWTKRLVGGDSEHFVSLTMLPAVPYPASPPPSQLT